MKKIITISGPADIYQLGHILPHEHVFSKKTAERPPLYPSLLDADIALENLGRIRRDIYSSRTNLILDDTETAVNDLSRFRARGGGAVVDLTTPGRGRDIARLAEVSRLSGVSIIASTGFYTEPYHPGFVSGSSVEALANLMIKELTDGIDGTRMRAGVIGEIGVSSPMTDGEKKALTAAAMAHKSTGAPIYIHQNGGGELEKIRELLEANGVPPASAAICHMDTASSRQRLDFARAGYYVCIDSFGHEYYLDANIGQITRDPEKVKMIKELAEAGLRKQILISGNVCLKILQCKYGGWGYEHLIVNMRPFMLRAGLAIKTLDIMLYYNPARFLAYADEN